MAAIRVILWETGSAGEKSAKEIIEFDESLTKSKHHSATLRNIWTLIRENGSAEIQVRDDS